jgi:DNA-binding NarL/FixJ family response regulator
VRPRGDEGHVGVPSLLSERTAGNHVLPILQNLGVDSRTAAAGFAVRHGLV